MPGIAANQDTYRTSSNIAGFATLNNVVKGFHDFLGRHITIHPVNLKDVDIRSKTFHAAIHSVKDILPRQADLVHAGAIIARQLRRVDGSPSSSTNWKHLDMMTTFERGMLYSLMAAPTISSDLPFEYVSATSHVLMPRSKAYLRTGRASSLSRSYGCQFLSPNLIHPRMT